MSKKDYQAIATALYRLNQAYVGPAREPWQPIGFKSIINTMAEVLAEGNPRFDRGRFIEACETGRCRGMRQVLPIPVT